MSVLAFLIFLDVDFFHVDAAVFDIDFLSSTTNCAVTPHGTIPSLLFMRLSKDDASLANDMVQTLGSAFGTKHGTRAIDSCVADFYDAFIARSSTSIPMQTQFVSQSEWLHKWVGNLVLAREVSWELATMYLVKCLNSLQL